MGALRRHRQGGYSLLEIVFIILFLGLIGTTVAAVLNQGVNIFAKLSERQVASSEAQYALDRMVKELRLLGSGDITAITSSRIDFNATYFRTSGVSPILLYRGSNALTTNNISQFVLTYYDNTGATTATASAVRRIKIELGVSLPISTNKSVSLREEVFLRDFYYENFQ